jgi:outer membrane protein, heavy metal efflux system
MFLRRRLLAFSGSLLLCGCLYNARERTDKIVCDLAAHPLDLTAAQTPTGKPPTTTPMLPPPDVQTSALLLADSPVSPLPEGGIRQVVFQGQEALIQKDGKKLFEIPKNLPGADAPKFPQELSKDPDVRLKQIKDLYKELPPLPKAPVAQPGPNGNPYTLADLQQIAASHSPTLRQAASDVEAARGNLITAAAYPNPTLGFQFQPSNNGSTSGASGFYIDQVIKTGGKLRLATVASLKALENAELALKRARSDLATQVRNAYFALLVAEESVRINQSLAQFTDDVYRLQITFAEARQAAPYEPATLRAQAFTVRLAYYQSIQNYEYAWIQLVATIGERQLPLGQVAGRIDAVIPFYDYDAVLAHVLDHHTDVLTARNGIKIAEANLKLQQVTPIPDVDLQVGIFKEFAVSPELFYQTVQLAVPIPVWDQNKGPILTAEAALVRATEEPHRVEDNLRNNLANAYNNYTNNLAALEYYRRYILPDLVRTYQAIYERRYEGRDLQGVVFSDIVTAQQALVSNVATYLTTLGQLWTSVTGVADFLQTDNLFQLGEPVGLPPLPDFSKLPGWPCCHPCAEGGAACGIPVACSPVPAGTVTPTITTTTGQAASVPAMPRTSAGTLPTTPLPLPAMLPSYPAGPALPGLPPSTNAPPATLPPPRSSTSPLDVLMDRLPPADGGPPPVDPVGPSPEKNR